MSDKKSMSDTSDLGKAKKSLKSGLGVYLWGVQWQQVVVHSSIVIVVFLAKLSGKNHIRQPTSSKKKLAFDQEGGRDHRQNQLSIFLFIFSTNN